MDDTKTKLDKNDTNKSLLQDRKMYFDCVEMHVLIPPILVYVDINL